MLIFLRFEIFPVPTRSATWLLNGDHRPCLWSSGTCCPKTIGICQRKPLTPSWNLPKRFPQTRKRKQIKATIKAMNLIGMVRMIQQMPFLKSPKTWACSGIRKWRSMHMKLQSRQAPCEKEMMHTAQLVKVQRIIYGNRGSHSPLRPLAGSDPIWRWKADTRKNSKIKTHKTWI